MKRASSLSYHNSIVSQTSQPTYACKASQWTSEMTYIVSGGALNYSLLNSRLPSQ